MYLPGTLSEWTQVAALISVCLPHSLCVHINPWYYIVPVLVLVVLCYYCVGPVLVLTQYYCQY